MSSKKAILAVLSLFALANCSVGPKYKVPTLATPSAYKEPPPAEYKEDAGWKTAQPADAVIRPKWWETFQDPKLNELEEQIEPANQTLKAAEARFRQARAMIKFNRADQFPTISTAPSVVNAHASANTAFAGAGRGYNDFTLPIDLNYEVDLWGRVRHSVEAAREEFQATAGDLQTVNLSLHSELAVDYFELRSLDAQKALLDETVTTYTRAVELTQNRYSGGLAPKADLAQAQTQLESTRAQDIDTGQLRAQFEHAIATLIGKPPEDFSIPPLPQKLNPPVIPVGVPSQLLERRPDIASAERRVAEANAQVGIARAAFFPSLLISATGGLLGSSVTNWFNWPSRFWAVGPSMLQTVFDGGRRRATSEGAIANYDAMVADYRQTTLTAFQQVEDNLAALRVLSDEAKTQRGAVQAAEESLLLATNRYKGGLATYLDVITSQTIALTNERTEVDILRRRMDASVLLVKALGGGWNVGSLPKS
jgi:NodT family efflux transporter outer membrane factor (OMF) lipoprotein